MIALFFSACSTKEVFEPLSVDEDWTKYENSKFDIIDTSSNIALLEDRKVLSKDGVYDINVDLRDRVISQSGGWIITSSIEGNLTLISQNDNNITENLELKKSVAGASVNGNTLAILFADNEIALYEISSKKVLFKEQGGKYIVTDSRIVNPFFMRGLVLFATLDGKVVFVNKTKNKRLRTVIVSSEDNFNNVISLNVVDNKIIAATGYKILSMAKKEIRVKYEIRDIVYDDTGLFIATKQGEVIALTPDLQVVSKMKFPFAHFYGMVQDEEKLYVLEKEGYIIVLDKKTFDYTVHEVDFEDGYIFTSRDTFYINDKQILTK